MNLPFDKTARLDGYELEQLNVLHKAIAALKTAESHLRPALGVELRLTLINGDAAQALDQQWRPVFNQNADIEQRYYGTWAEHFFVPERLDEEYLIDNINNFDDPGAFNVAVWCGPRLVGIGRGGYQDEQKRGFVSVHLREGDPDPHHPFKGKIGRIIHEAASCHARAFGVDKVYYIGPFSPGAVKVHESMGFKKQMVETRPGEHQTVYVGPVPGRLDQRYALASNRLFRQEP